MKMGIQLRQNLLIIKKCWNDKTTKTMAALTLTNKQELNWRTKL